MRPVEHQRQVGGDDGFADAALARDDRDHPSVAAPCPVWRGRPTTLRLADGLSSAFAYLKRVHPVDRGNQIVPGERLLEHLAGACEHRPAKELAPAFHR